MDLAASAAGWASVSGPEDEYEEVADGGATDRVVRESAIDEADTGRHRLAFTGSGGEYFRIWIVNVLLSIVTLYVYSAWAKVRTKRYFHANTMLDGSSFDYHARPLQILAGRLIAVALLLTATFGGIVHPLASLGATLVLLAVLPWAVWRSTMFNARMTSYRNVRFGFEGELGRMYLYMLVLPFLPVVGAAAIGIALAAAGIVDQNGAAIIVVAGVALFYLLAPWVHATLAGYIADNHRYGRATFAARLSPTRFCAIYIQSFVVFVVATIVMAAIGGVIAVAASLFVTATGVLDGVVIGGLPATNGVAADVPIVQAIARTFLYPLVFILAAFAGAAFVQTRIRQHLFESIIIDDHVRLESTLDTGRLWRTLVGNLFLLAFTLGIAYPWTKVRLARVLAEHTAVLAPNGLRAVVDDERAYRGSVGEEIGDAFDMDLDVGF